MNRSYYRSCLFALSLALGAGSLTACSGYGRYDPVDRTADIDSLPDPNQPNIQRVYTAALKFVISRYRQGGEEQPIAINLPPGTRQSNYYTVASQVGPNVQPLTQEIANTNSMPIYHVGEIQLRGNNADVDIYRPTTELGPDPKTGKPVYVTVRVKLEGGLKPWRPLIGRSYPPGMLQPPQYYVLPPTEDPFQFQNWKQAQKDLALASSRADLDARIEKMPTGNTPSTTDGANSSTHAEAQPETTPVPK